MTDFLVSTTLRLNDELVRGLRRVIETLDRTQFRVDRLQRSFARLGFATAPKIETAGIARAQQMMERLDGAARKFSTEVLRPRVDLRAAEAGITRLKGDLVALAAPVMPAGTAIPGARVGAPDLAATERSVMALRLREATAAKRAEAALAAQRERDIRAAAVLQRRESEQNMRHAMRLVNEQARARIAAEKTFLREQAALEKQHAAAKPTVAASGGAGHGNRIGSLLFGHRAPSEDFGRERMLRYGGGGLLGLAFGGAYEQAHLIEEVNRILLGAGQPLGSRYRGQVANLIQSVSSETGVNYQEAGEAIKNTVLGFQAGSQGKIPFATRLGFAASRARYAMIEHIIKPEISLSEAEQASIGLTHMAQQYSPAGMRRIQADIAAITTITPFNLRRVENAASYAMPMASLAGISPETVFAIIAANQVGGVVNTKSGTWLGQLITTGLNPKGGLAALLSTKSGRERAAAMERLGLISPTGELIGMKMLQAGRLDLLQKTLAAHTAGIPKAQLPGLFDIAAGGVQAGRELGQLALPNIAANIMYGISKQQHFLREGSKAALAEYAKFSPIMQFHKTMMDFINALTRLGTVVLPPLTDVLRSLDATLKAIIPSLPGAKKEAMPSPHQISGTGLVAGGAIGTLFGGPVGGVIGAGVGAVAGYGAGAQLNATAAQLKSGYVVLPSPGAIVVAPLPSKSAGAAALAHGGWGAFGGWLHDLFSSSAAKPHAPAHPQGWGEWLWSFVLPSAHAETMPGVKAALAARHPPSAAVLDTAGQALAHSFGLALPMVDFGPAGLAIARSVAQAMGQMAAAGPARSLLVPASYETTTRRVLATMSPPLGGRFALGAPVSGATTGGEPIAALGQYYAYLKSRGLGDAQAAAITANIWQESSGRPGIVGDYGTSIGLFQEHDARAAALMRTVPNWRANWRGQIDHALGEMRRIDPAWFSLTGSRVAAAEWERLFERPKSLADVGIRAAHADLLLRQFSHRLPGPPPRPVAGGELRPDHEAIGGAVAKALHEHLKSMTFDLGDTHLSGDVLLDGAAVGYVLAHHLERGLARASSGGMARSGARPDFSGGPVLNPPV